MLVSGYSVMNTLYLDTHIIFTIQVGLACSENNCRDIHVPFQMLLDGFLI